MIEAVEAEGLVVYRRDDSEKRQVAVTEGEVAYFALLAADMLDLAEKYKRDVEEVHLLFFQVSCDRDRLIRLLEGKARVDRWQQLEDLAVKEKPGSAAFDHVLASKGPEEVLKRQQFLQYTL